MFKLQPPDTFHTAVEISEPGGTVQTLQVEFKWFARADFVEYCRTGKELPDPEFFSGMLAGWDADEPCDLAGVTKLLAYRPKAGAALFAAFSRELLEVEEKN